MESGSNGLKDKLMVFINNIIIENLKEFYFLMNFFIFKILNLLIIIIYL